MQQQQQSDNVELAPNDVDQQQSTVDEATTQQQQSEDSHDQGQGKADVQGEEGHQGTSDSVDKKQSDQQNVCGYGNTFNICCRILAGCCVLERISESQKYAIVITCISLFSKGRKRKDFQRSKEERKLETTNDVSEAKRRKAFDAEESNLSQDDNQVCFISLKFHFSFWNNL